MFTRRNVESSVSRRTGPHRRPAPRRGVAMLLVLVSLLVATILSSAYLASRDNSAALGRNVAAASAARWGAMTGIDLGVAILQTETDWRNAHVDGKLLADQPVAGALLDLDVVDVETSAPPTDYTDRVKLTATARAGGVTQVATAYATLVLDESDRQVNVDLSEFAAFAESTITVSGSGLITRWPAAPASVLGRQVNIGTQSISAASVAFSDSGIVLDGLLYAPPGSSGSLMTGGGDTREVMTSATIPMPGAPDPGVGGAGTELALPYALAAVTQTLSTDFRATATSLSTGAAVLFDGPASGAPLEFVSDGNALIWGNSVLTIDGRVKIVVWGDLTLNSGSIELLPDAMLDLFVGGALTVTNGYIGPDRPVGSSDRDTSGMLAGDPRQVRIYTASPPTIQNWTASQTSVIVGTLYAPDADVTLQNQTALYGRVAAHSITVRDDAVIYYDHGLDAGSGWTNPDVSLWAADGSVDPDFAALTTLDYAALAQLSDERDLLVFFNGAVEGTVNSLKSVVFTLSGLLTSPPPSGPTPRPNHVDVDLASWGGDVADWESNS